MGLEQLKQLEPEELMGLRVRQLMIICAQLGDQQGVASRMLAINDNLEKKDLVALIVKHR